MKYVILAIAAFFCCVTHLCSQIEPRTTINDYLDADIGTLGFEN